jgi:predicted dehydrogenase
VNNSKLRVATAGTGFFSQFHYNGWKRMADDGIVELVAIYNRSGQRATEFAEQYGFKSVYNDFESMLDNEAIDLVDIITPPETHDRFVRAAVDRDIAVICQKPFTPDYASASLLVDHIENRQGRVFIHEDFRFQPWYSKIKSLIEEGKIGEPYQVSFWLRPGDGQGPEAYLDRQPYFQQMPRFLVHETAIHLIDTFRYLFGEVSSVYAQLDRLNPVITGEDAGIILFEFENGCRGLFDGNRLADHAANNCRLTMGEMRIEGSEATLSLDGFGNLDLRRKSAIIGKPVQYDWNDFDFGGDCVYLTNRHLVDHLTKNSPAMNTAAEYLVNLQIEQAVYQSAASARKIQLKV